MANQTIYRNVSTGKTTANTRVAQIWMKMGHKVVKIKSEKI